MLESHLWKKLSENKDKKLMDSYLDERVQLEKYSPMMFIPITSAGIFGLSVLFLLSLSNILLYIITLLSLLLIGVTVIYFKRLEGIKKKYASRCE